MVTDTGQKPDVLRSAAQMARFDGEIKDLFSSRSPREEEEVSLLGLAGAEKFPADLKFSENNGTLVATGPGLCQIKVTNLHFVL